MRRYSLWNFSNGVALDANLLSDITRRRKEQSLRLFFYQNLKLFSIIHYLLLSKKCFSSAPTRGIINYGLDYKN